MGVSFLCPNCNKSVDPIAPNAMMSAATKQWQHKDCWKATAPVVEPERSSAAPRRKVG
jgi:hypothetical protein